MDIIKRMDLFIREEGTCTGDVATNNTQGNIDVVGGKCKEGYKWDPKKKVCIPTNNEGRK